MTELGKTEKSNLNQMNHAAINIVLDSNCLSKCQIITIAKETLISWNLCVTCLDMYSKVATAAAAMLNFCPLVASLSLSLSMRSCAFMSTWSL